VCLRENSIAAARRFRLRRKTAIIPLPNTLTLPPTTRPFVNARLLTLALLGRAPAESHSQRRYGSILRGGATALVAKIVAMAAGFAAVPLTLHHLGAQRYGLWATLFSILAWLSLADLGLSNGLINALSEAFAHDRRDLAREYVSTAFWGLWAIAAVAAVVLAACYPLIDWSRLMHIGSPAVAREFRTAIALAAALFLLNLPFTIIGRIFVAAQRPAVANLWAIVTSVGTLAGLAAAILAGGGLPALVLGFSGAQAVVSIASAIWLFGRAHPELMPTRTIARSSLRRVFGVAASFFVTQVATLLLFQSANVLISHNLGPRYVAPYQITWMLFMYVTLPQQLIGANIWAAIGDAYAREDIRWIRGLFRRYALLSAAIGVPLILALTVLAQPLVNWWAGEQVVPPLQLVLWMAAWACVLLVMQPITSVLAGTGRLRLYSVLSMVGASVSVVAAARALPIYGTSGVVASYVVGFGAIAVIPAILQVAGILREEGARPVITAGGHVVEAVTRE
jgi:O-antigen/teichoic acid export membrane protein